MSRHSYIHVQDNFEAGPPCRFCDDPSNTNNKGPVVQTSTAPDGRPLYAHEECDNPFEFADSMRYFDDLETPNPVDDDFILTALTAPNPAHAQYIHQLYETRTHSMEGEGDTPRLQFSTPPGSIRSKVSPMTQETQADTIGENGTAEPPK